MGDLRADPERMARVKTGARLLDVLAPLGPYWPDFLTPHESKSGLMRRPGRDHVHAACPIT
ncbi:hypothetical protein ACFSTC_40375 [Nonomuraea ferruginea]